MSFLGLGLGPVLALNLLITFAVPRISIGGHVGGLAAGALVALIHVEMVRSRRSQWEAVGATVALGALFVVGSLVLASNPVF